MRLLRLEAYMKILSVYSDKINGVLSSFDRIIINGYLLNLQNSRQFLYYLIQNNVQLVDFASFAQKKTKALCDHIEQFTLDNNAELHYMYSSKTSKSELAHQIFEKNPTKTGLIATLSIVEPCRKMTVLYDKSTNKLSCQSQYTKCKWYYLYFNDSEFGWMFFKIQTWFPFNVTIYINGREYLSKLFNKENIQYTMYNNSFSSVSNFDKAQNIADSILNKHLSDSFDGLASKINIHIKDIQRIMGHSYYWCVEACEFATDITFKERSDLEIFYKKLVETSYFTFSCNDIYSFFGRNIKYIHQFKGEISADLRNRYLGYRIKFKLGKNQVKMYDKSNSLRIEVTINDPKDFKIYKEVESKDGTTTKKWVPMGKSVANLYRYAEISKNIINRYIEALPEINLENIRLTELENISKPITVEGRKYSGFNLLNSETLRLFEIISQGKFLIKGFNNAHVRKELYEDSDNPKIINKVTRLLSKLRQHNLIKKINHKNRYMLTVKGRRIISNLLLYTNREILS